MNRSGFLGLLLALALPPGAAHAAETIEYVALVDGGKQAGHQIVVHGDDGVTRVDFLFKDNGRGPELKEEYTLAADGTFATYSVKGQSTFGAPVDESFAIENGIARWKSTSDAGPDGSGSAGTRGVSMGRVAMRSRACCTAGHSRESAKRSIVASSRPCRRPK